MNDKKPVVAATDYIRAYAEQIRAYVPGTYTVLGTDGFGRSDTRKALRAFFGVDAATIAYVAAKQLADQGNTISKDIIKQLEKNCAAGLDKDPYRR